MILQRLINFFVAGDPQLRGYVYAFPNKSRTEQEDAAILPIRENKMGCTHKNQLCLSEKCLFSWRFVFGYIAFEHTRAGRWYVKQLQSQSWCPEDLKENK